MSAIILCWAAVQLRRGKRQRLAVEAIVDSGGSVGYDFQLTRRHHPDRKASSAVPAFLRLLCGVDAFHRVEYVVLSGPDVCDDLLSHLVDLPNLRRLFIAGDAVTDDGLGHLRNLTSLEDLSLRVPATDESLDQLSSLRSLRTLFLMGDSDTYRYQSKAGPVFDNDDYNSDVTRAGVEKFVVKQPRCRVSF
ncbi:MAG: hypothetical protein WBD31_15650 [Rubripirellula sp.]